jgi:probable addiction module antidote protein
MPLKTRPYDAAAYLNTDAAIAAYLTEALETNDPALIADALGAVARARGMSEVARSAGISRASLYRALSAEGNPELSTVLRVLNLFKLRLAAVPQRARKDTVAAKARKAAARRQSALIVQA